MTMSEQKKAAAKPVAEGYNTTDLSNEVAEVFSMTKAQASRVVMGILTMISNNVAEGKMVRLHGFGNFKKLDTKERKGRNPKTGEETLIPASHRPHFTASQNFKNKVKEGTTELIDAGPQVAEAPQPVQAAPKQAVPAQPKAAPKVSAPRPAQRPIPRAQKPAPAPTPVEPADLDGLSAIDEL